VTRRDVGEIMFTMGMSHDAALLEKMREENRILREEIERRSAEAARITAEAARAAAEAARITAEAAQIKAEKEAQIEALVSQIKEHEKQEAILRHRLDQMCRRVFGRQAEKVDPNQLALAFEILKDEGEIDPPPFVDEAPDVESAATKKRKGHGRIKLPKDLPRERIEHHPSPEELRCAECGGEKRVMVGAEETTEELDYVPASFVVREHVRFNYSCAHCQEGVVCPAPPPQLIEKGRPGPGLLAHVVTSKYCDHLPLNRLEGIFERHGVEIARSTQCDWVTQASFLVRPIVAEITREALSALVVQTDDTPVRVLDRQAPGGSKLGRLWVYRGEPGSVFFDYTPTRARDGPLRVLERYEGYLQADAYAGYDEIFRTRSVTEVGCMAHARRKFFDALATEPKAASYAVAAIRQLYEVEREAKEFGLDDEAPRLATLPPRRPTRSFGRWAATWLPQS
jgi:transposase